MKNSGLFALIAVVFSMGRLFAREPADPNGKEKTMDVTIKWFGHASFKISDANTVIYIDPWKLKDAAHDADIVLVSHSHYDHLSAEDIEKVSDPNTRLIASGDVVKQLKKGDVLMPGQSIVIGEVNITGVPAYNPAKKFHPKSNNWLGFVIEISGKRIYYAGDTDVIDEMKALQNIKVALLPVGGKFTMNASEAAEAVKLIKPEVSIPYHWGDIVGTQTDAEKFASEAPPSVLVPQPGDALTFH